MESPHSEEKKISPAEQAYRLWHTLPRDERTPNDGTTDIQEEFKFLVKGQSELSIAIDVHKDEIRAELERDKKRIEQKLQHSLPQGYEALIFVNKYIGENLLGWAIKKYDPLHPEKFALWYQLYLGSNFVMQDLRDPLENLWGERSQLPGLVIEEERLRKSVENPDNPSPDPEDMTLAVHDAIERATELEDILKKDKTGFGLADHGLEEAIKWGNKYNYQFVKFGADFAMRTYKQVYETITQTNSSPSSSS